MDRSRIEGKYSRRTGVGTGLLLSKKAYNYLQNKGVMFRNNMQLFQNMTPFTILSLTHERLHTFGWFGCGKRVSFSRLDFSTFYLIIIFIFKKVRFLTFTI